MDLANFGQQERLRAVTALDTGYLRTFTCEQVAGGDIGTGEHDLHSETERFQRKTELCTRSTALGTYRAYGTGGSVHGRGEGRVAAQM